ncbi:MAG: gamma-glutamyltransferase, partial [Actinomycetota bacterium]|nr:gamma-glutamyltransferase [Actinomycetota bacterium]
DQARTLRAIAESHGERFYRGDVAERIAAHAATSGAALSAEDLDAHRADWVQPLALAYRGVTVHELPPNSQGLAALIALGILQRLPAEHPVDSADALHTRIEATKLALADVYHHVADPAAMKTTPEALLDAGHLSRRAGTVDPVRAIDPGHGLPHRGGTVYVAAADAEGTMVSFIQSSFHGFGAGVVVPGTGISLSNRGAGFSTVPGHPNQVTPGKRPFHTTMPGFVRVGQRALCAFGVMGAALQPQGHVQVLTRVVEHGQNPQAAVDAPRWRLEGGLDVAFEPGHDPAVVAELARRGHRVVPARGMGGFGGAQIVWRLEHGWLGASDPRKDGQAVGF